MEIDKEMSDTIMRVISELRSSKAFSAELESILKYFSDGYSYAASGGQSSRIDPSTSVAFSNRSRAIEDLRKLLFEEKEKTIVKKIKV